MWYHFLLRFVKSFAGPYVGLQALKYVTNNSYLFSSNRLEDSGIAILKSRLYNLSRLSYLDLNIG